MNKNIKYIVDIDALSNLVDLLPVYKINGDSYISRDYIKELINNFPKDLVENSDEARHEKIGYWEFWEGWIGNHDQRIEDATCSECGYMHSTVRRNKGETANKVLKKLATICPGCGAKMIIKN